MLRDQAEYLRADVEAVDRVDVQSIQEPRRRLDAGLLVVERADPAIEDRRCRRFAEVVAQGAEHDGDEPRPIEVRVEGACLVDDHERVRPDVAFRMPFRLLLAPDERPQLRQQPVDDAEIERERESD
jgi:hypothetical protein